MNRAIFTILSQEHNTHQIFWVDYTGAELSLLEVKALEKRIIDPIDQKFLYGIDVDSLTVLSKLSKPLELVCFRPGVTDNPAKSFQELIARDEAFKNKTFHVHSGLLKAGGRLSFNPMIQTRKTFSDVKELKELLSFNFEVSVDHEIKVHEYSILTSSDEELVQLSQKNCWALSLTEMKAIQEHFRNQGRNPTDVELEMLAQTWSEHCKHKIFNAHIDYQDENQKIEIQSLFKEFIKKPTYDLNKDWAISVFDDNAGVVRFREGIDLCVKVETHNSPSALDPYGGALTGILGVNRDIMGTGLGAKPVANTNVFCVGMPDENEMPKALLHPTEILKGIHRGVMDGGNKSGIPTVNGAIYFDESYSGKPLVYCGTVGVLPSQIQNQSAIHKGQRPGDLVVMVGGEVGIDGIHGATASSLVMDKSTTLGMVQIGDPFSQKRMLDFLLVARDKLLYNSITDNGAGGLSSSVGEMAGATNGAILNLETVPLKYPGLLPWQILVSESQERMTLSVPKENWEELKKLGETYQVQLTNVGEFTENGKLTCKFNGKVVCDLDLHFLHEGLPKMNLVAKFTKQEFKSWKKEKNQKNVDLKDHQTIMNKLLSHPSIASKEKWVRQYDHEVQGATVVKPFEGLNDTAPNNAGVMWYGAYGVEGKDGFAVASGLCPHFSIDDAYLMSKLAVDEAVRNLICHGADPEKIALVDNFCWPDPTPSAKNPDAEFKLAQLVRSCMALKEMVMTYGMPLVSGKDSMKNDYHGEEVKISVLPTLLVTALGHVPDVTRVPKSQVEVGKLVYRLGKKDYQKYFGHFIHSVSDIPRDNLREFNWSEMRSLYKKIFKANEINLISSLHDISEGGFMVALFETLMMEKAGIDLNVDQTFNETAYLYSELPGHFVVSIKPHLKESFEDHFDSSEWEFIGTANFSNTIKLNGSSLSMNEMEKIWRQV